MYPHFYFHLSSDDQTTNISIRLRGFFSVRDLESRKKLKHINFMNYLRRNDHFFLFLLDFYKWRSTAKKRKNLHINRQHFIKLTIFFLENILKRMISWSWQDVSSSGPSLVVHKRRKSFIKYDRKIVLISSRLHYIYMFAQCFTRFFCSSSLRTEFTFKCFQLLFFQLKRFFELLIKKVVKVNGEEEEAFISIYLTP